MENKPLRITVEHYDSKITIEKDRSDVFFDDYMEMLKVVTSAIYTRELWDEYFEEPIKED